MPNIRQASFDSEIQVVGDDFHAPASPHVVVTAPWLSFSHESKVHGRSNGLAIKGQIHATHGEKGALRHGHHRINVASVAFHWLDHLSGCIVVGNVEPEAVGDGGWTPFAPREGVASYEVGSFSIWVVESVEKVGGGGGEEVLDVLFEGVDVFS